MKRFAIFGGQRFYARGGFSDLMGHEDTVDAAIRRAKDLAIEYRNKDRHEIEWYQIVDLTTGEVVYSHDEALGANSENNSPYQLVFVKNVGELQPVEVEDLF